MSYESFAQKEASEKILLAQISASKFLKGFIIHSGSIYKITGFYHPVIESIEDSGVALTSVSDVSSVTAGTYFNDYENETLYVRTSDSVNPNGKVLVCSFKNFFSNVPAQLPHDLDSGFDVEWLPLIKASSQFGVEIDNQIDQLGISIDGKGSITLLNDKTYWASRFDKWYWENNSVSIYSYGRELLPTEAKLLFRGKIQSKSYSTEQVSFQVADNFFQIRQAVPLDQLGNAGIYPLVFSQTLKRNVYGLVRGMKPQNIQQLIEGKFDLSSVANISASSMDTITFDAPIAYTYFRKGDSISISGVGEFNIESLVSTTVIQLSTELSTKKQADAIGADYSVKPATARAYFNRNWQVSGHALYEPQAIIQAMPNQNTIQVDDASGFYVGYECHGDFTDSFFVNKTVIEKIIGNAIVFNNPIAYTATVGGTLKMSPVQNVRINSEELRLGFSYEVDAANGQMTLLSEEYLFPRKIIPGSLTFTNGSDLVTGVGTKFLSDVSNLSKIFPEFGGVTSYQVIEIIDDTNLRISVSYPGVTDTFSSAEQLEIEYFDYLTDTLSIDCFGKTDDGLSTGNLLYRAPEICEDLLVLAGLQDELDTASFDSESEIADQMLGVLIPTESTARKAPQIKDVINQINKSVFGVIVQDDDFKLKYKVIRPTKAGSFSEFKERDIIGFELSSDGSDIVKEVKVNYNANEYNGLAGERTFDFEIAQSKVGQYLARSQKTFEIDTLLVNQNEAMHLAQRLAFYLSFSRVSATFQTKLQGSSLQVTEGIKIDHRFLFERIGLSNKVKLGQTMRVRKDAFGSVIEMDDLGNTYSSVCTITEDDALDYVSAPLEELLINGYITDEYGMQDNDPETYGQNLIW